MSNIQVINSNFKYSNLDKTQMTITLIKECVRVKILDEKILFKVQIDLSNILQDIIIKYTKGQSSSITVENTEKLIIAIWYTIDAYVTSKEGIDSSIEVVKNETLKEMYEKGKEILEDEFENTKILYESILKNKLDTEVMAYNDTIKSIEEFFKYYDIDFEPHEIPGASIDYPLAFDDWDIKGVYYIKNYLWHVYIENNICNYFEKVEIDKILESYGNMYKINYRDLLINIFELTVNNAVFSSMSKNHSASLSVSEKNYNYLNESLRKLTEDEVVQLINICIEKIIQDLNLNNENELNYIYKYKKNIISATITSLKKNKLRNTLVITEINETSQNNSTIEENALDDEDFRIIIDEILCRKNINEKIDFIRIHINSIKDFIDVLKSNCLFNDEYTKLFESLSDLELGILGKYVFYGEYRMDHLNLVKTLSSNYSTDYEWENYYLSFLRKINKIRLNEIQKIINSNIKL